MFDWKNNLHLEELTQRTHTSKDFPDPENPKQRIKIQSSGLFHALTDDGFKDLETELPDYKFPEGKELNAGESKHEIMEFPSWAKVKLEEDGRVRVYDIADEPLFIYSDPVITPVGKKPYEVIKDGEKIGDSVTVVIEDKEAETKRAEHTVDARFVVEDNKLFFETEPLTESMSAFDDTTKAGLNNFNQLNANSPTLVGTGGTYGRAQQYSDGNRIRSVIKWTTPASMGTITAMKVYMYAFDMQNTSLDVSVYNILRSWNPSYVCWNNYDNSTAWTTAGCTGAGTDYNSTAIDSVATPATPGWVNFVLYGTGSDSPVTPAWATQYNLLFRCPESGIGGFAMYSPEYTDDVAKRPYLEITYTATLTDGLAAYYKLSDVNDASGNSKTLSNDSSVTFGAGLIGNCSNFGSSGDAKSLYIADSLGVVGDASISFWIKPTGLGANYFALALWDTVNKVKIDVYFNSTEVNVRRNIYGTGYKNISSTHTLSTSAFTHIVYTYDGANSRCYINGSLTAGPTDGSGIGSNATAAKFILNSDGEASASYGNGLIDEVGIWRRALTTTEITALYNSGAGFQYPFLNTNLKTIGGIAYASVKTVDGIAIASVKTVDGIA